MAIAGRLYLAAATGDEADAEGLLQAVVDSARAPRLFS